jgi:hypothetical protein
MASESKVLWLREKYADVLQVVPVIDETPRSYVVDLHTGGYYTAKVPKTAAANGERWTGAVRVFNTTGFKYQAFLSEQEGRECLRLRAVEKAKDDWLRKYPSEISRDLAYSYALPVEKWRQIAAIIGIEVPELEIPE